MGRDWEYENNNIAFNWRGSKGEEGIKCKNYEVCEAVLPKWWFECKGNYLCTNCHMMFGTWSAINAGMIYVKCPICLEVKRSIAQPNCKHTICIKCFKRCYYGDNDTENEPKFPYPDIEDEYYDDQDNSKWDKDYPLIKIHHEEWNKWDDEKDKKYSNEVHLRKCPLCRK